MLETVYCANRYCTAFKKPIKYAVRLLAHITDCAVCGAPMVDGERSNDDFKNGRKKVGKKLVSKGRYVRTNLKKAKKSMARKRVAYKR